MHGPRPLVCLQGVCALFGYHFTTTVKTTLGANPVRKAFFTTVAAQYQVLRFQGVMGTAAILSSA